MIAASPAPPTNDLTAFQTIDFSPILKSLPSSPTDPLTDAFFLNAHKRPERQEKQLRNIERERAQHEKVQLDRLLEGLKGHDWLKVMGISGITESERKTYEGKRAWFIREVTALIDKFKAWKEEERRRKMEKEASVRDEDEEDDADDEEEEGSDEGMIDDSESEVLQRC
jgi:hypothetical protein